MFKMLSGVVISLVAFAAMVTPSFAEPDWSVSGNANPNACFGQARAYFAEGGPNGVLSPDSNGSVISMRKGANPENNANFIATYCTQ